MSVARQFAAVGILLVAASSADCQNIIYHHDFSGAALAPLHGQIPDIENNVGTNTWVTRTDTGLPAGTGVKWFDDGSIDASLAGSGAASLAFSPVAGNIYTLSASFDAIDVGNPDYWVAMGFSAGQATGPGFGAEFYGNGSPTHITGQPWMLYRNSGSAAPDQTFLGPGTDGGGDWSAPVVPSRGAAVDLRIVLDTSAPAWTAEWLAKNPTDATYTAIRPTTTYTVNPTILAVAVTALDTVGGSISSFTLETDGAVVPEPTSMLLVTLGFVGLASSVARRRRR